MVSLIIVEWKRPNKVNTLLSRTLDWDIVRFNLFFLLSKLSLHFFMCEECSTYGAQFKRMCIAVILCINDALWLIFSSFSIFLQISWKMAISRKKLSSSERTKNRGSKLSLHFFMCEECSTYGAQFKRMCIAVILCINDALWLIFSSFSIFLQISWKMAISRKKLSSSERTKNRGSIRHRPPPHPPLINNFLSYDDSCLPCGNNICLIRMFL